MSFPRRREPKALRGVMSRARLIAGFSRKSRLLCTEYSPGRKSRIPSGVIPPMSSTPQAPMGLPRTHTSEAS